MLQKALPIEKKLINDFFNLKKEQIQEENKKLKETKAANKKEKKLAEAHRLARERLNKTSSLRQTLIGTLPESVQEKINAADARKAFIKQMQDMGWTGRKANQLLAEYDQSVEARRANKGAGQFEGIGDIWKRIQSGTMRPEIKTGQKTLQAVKDTGITLEKIYKVLSQGQVAIAG